MRSNEGRRKSGWCIERIPALDAPLSQQTALKACSRIIIIDRLLFAPNTPSHPLHLINSLLQTSSPQVCSVARVKNKQTGKQSQIVQFSPSISCAFTFPYLPTPTSPQSCPQYFYTTESPIFPLNIDIILVGYLLQVFQEKQTNEW